MQRDFLIEIYEAQEPEENESLAHHGVNGMHWGVRRYQNKDGSLTPEGRRHWGIGDKIQGAKTAINKKIKATKSAALRKKKNAILARGDVDEVLKNKHLFTTKELDKAIGRSQRLSMLKAMTPEEQKAREKAVKDREKAARGREAVEKGLYAAGQLVQMAPAMLQGYAILRGLLGGGGSGPSPSSAPSPSSTSSPSSAPSPSSTSSPSSAPSPSFTSSPSSAPSPSSTSSPSSAPSSYNLTMDGHKTKYKTTGQDTHNYIHSIDTSSAPSWSTDSTNAIFVNTLGDAAGTPMSSLLTSYGNYEDYET